ncbi:MAG TPA: LysR family transcriptional regulator [Myxococcota bacterium]|nr:LysR family transcriptional regulator [Myxococcota bacterium]
MNQIHGNPLERLELHHLRALDLLLRTRSVTRTAERLGLTQSAVSHSLRQLREVLGDPLLVRKGDGLEPTPRAEAMADPLRRALGELGGALGIGTAWDPAFSRRSFVIVMPDTHALLLLPPLLKLLRTEAPGVDLDVRAAPDGRPELGLYSQGADMAVVVRSPELPGVMGSTLFEEEFACLVRADHPEVGAELDLATFVRLGHALMSPQGSGTTVVDTALEKVGLSRRIVLKIAYFLAAPLLVAQSDLVLTAPRRLAEQFATMAPLRVLKPPLPLPNFPVRMLWPERLNQDPGHRWLREALRRGI